MSGTVKSTPAHVEVVELQTKTAQMLEIAQSIRDLARELSSVVIELQAVDLTVAAPDMPSASGMFTSTGA